MDFYSANGGSGGIGGGACGTGGGFNGKIQPVTERSREVNDGIAKALEGTTFIISHLAELESALDNVLYKETQLKGGETAQQNSPSTPHGQALMTINDNIADCIFRIQNIIRRLEV